MIISTLSPTELSTFPIPPVRLFLVYSLAAKKCNRTSSAEEHPNAKAIFFPAEIADLANAIPTCLAAQTNITLKLSERPSGVSVLPVPVGAM